MKVVRGYKLKVKLRYCPNNEDKELWRRGRWAGCIADFEVTKRIAADLVSLPKVKDISLVEVSERVVWPTEEN